MPAWSGISSLRSPQEVCSALSQGFSYPYTWHKEPGSSIPGIWFDEPIIREAQETGRLVPLGRPELHSPSVPALKGLGRALELLRRRKGWSAAEAARHIPLDPSNLGKYERDAKSITVTTLERILDGYEATLADLAEVLKEVQGGSPVRWIVPGEVSEEDLKRVVKKVLGKDWVPDEPEEETSQDEELPKNGGDDG